MDRSQINEIVEICADALDSAGFECVDVEWVAHERILRVFVDTRDGSPIDMEGCVAANRCIKDLPELDEKIEGKYTLEVSSPGLDRPLRTAEHFRAHLGQNIRVKLIRKTEGRIQGTGQLVALSPDFEITMETQEGTWSFPLSEISRANLVYDWGEK